MTRVSVNVERLVRLQRRVTSLGENLHEGESPRWVRMKLAEVAEEIDSIILEDGKEGDR